MKSYTTLRAERDFVRLLGHGVENAHALLLLALLLHLEALRIDGMTPYPILDWHLFLAPTSTASRFFRYLNLNGSENITSEPLVWIDLGILGLMPNLTDIEMDHVSVTSNNPSSTEPASKTILVINFTDGLIDFETLKKILAYQKLESFHFRPTPAVANVSPQTRVSTNKVFKLLASSKQSLQKLCLFPTVHSKRPLCGQFSHLQNLEMTLIGFLPYSPGEDDPIAVVSLLRKQILMSLEKLSLRSLTYDSELVTTLEQIAQLKLQGELKSLINIGLNFVRFGVSRSRPLLGLLPVPDPEPTLHKLLGDFHEKAGIQLYIHQAG